MFFELEFKEENISITPLKRVEDFKEEALSLNHCVYTKAYYKEKDSLIMSAKINGEPTETVEISIPNLCVLQSRGQGNKATKHHENIVSLVQRNLNQIEKITAC